MDSVTSIDLNVAKRLKNDKEFRIRFFLAESSALIARQLIALRKRRGLNQGQVAELLETKQPAISRIESADYRSWSFNNLRHYAEALDARIRVLIEPVEDVLPQYEQEETKPETVKIDPTKIFTQSALLGDAWARLSERPNLIDESGRGVAETETSASARDMSKGSLSNSSHSFAMVHV